MNTPWASIAKIEADGQHSGTGFLITPCHVLTALHVVADNTGRPFPKIVLRFNRNAQYVDGGQEWETGAQIAEGLLSVDHHFALLKCDNPPPSAPLFLSDRRVQRDKCSSPGFAVQSPSGFTAIGDIASLNDPFPGGGTAIGIQFQIGSGVLMKGHSGAPVLVKNRVVGLLRTAFLDEWYKTMGGIAHATPIQPVVELCNHRIPGMVAFRPAVSWPSSVSIDGPVLADRKEEFEIFVRMITGTCSKRVLLLQGESGSGKTVLARELTEFAQRLGIHVSKVDCKGTPDLNSVVDSLLVDVPGVLAGTETANGASRFSEVIEDLGALDRPFLLALDTWQESSESVRKWIGQTLLHNMHRMPGVVVLIGGQRDLPDARGKTWQGVAEFRQLSRISSPQDWFDYTRRKWPAANIEMQHVEALTIVASGSPKLVSENLEILQEGLPARTQSAGNP